MNRTQVRSVLGIAACVVVYTTLTDAGRHITTRNADREAFAESLSNPDAGIFFSSSGPASRTLDVSLMPDRRDPGGCDSVMATLLVRQDFLIDVYDRGFRMIACDATDANGKITTLEDRIVPPHLEPPSTEPHTVPQRHSARVVEASA